MRNSNEHNSERYKGLASSKTRYFVVGLLIFLLCLIAIVDRSWPVGRLTSYPFIYLFGAFYIVPLIVGCLIGAYYFIRKTKLNLHIAGYIVAASFAIFFALIWASSSDATIANVFPTYGSHFTSINGSSYGAIVESGVGGGMIGYFFYAVLANLTSPLATTIIYYVGFILSLIFLLRPLIFFIYKKIRDKVATSKKEEEKPQKVTKSFNQVDNFASEQEQRRIDDILSKIKVIDTSAPVSEGEARPVNNDFLAKINIMNNDNNTVVDVTPTERGRAFNVFKDDIETFNDEKKEPNVNVRHETKGFNVFRDTLFDGYTSVEEHQAQPEVKKVYDISEEELIDDRVKEEPYEEEKVIEEPKEEPEVYQNEAVQEKSLDFNMFKKQEVLDEEEVFDYEEENIEEEEIREEPEVKEEIKPVEEPKPKPRRAYKLPPASLLNEISYTDLSENNTEAELKTVLLNSKLASLGIKAKVHDYKIAPAFTRFEIEVSSEVKINMFASIKNDLMMALSATNIDVLTPVPGTNYVGIDVPNKKRGTVYFKEVYVGIPFEQKDNKLLFAAGKDIIGRVIAVPIDKAPHMLVAGATGTGKSVCLNTIIVSLLMRATPDEVKIMLVDPKKVEFSAYSQIPHLLCPVITDPKKAAVALTKLCKEMDDRFETFSQAGKKNITFYNNYCKSIGKEPLPYIVVIIDELADLMNTARNEVEDSIRRITALARAAGIHLIVATQRPSVDVITGVIKSNIPSRIAFAVSSYQDSRTILDDGGAENLLGLGDMLMHMSGNLETQRVQGALVTDEEIDRVVDYCHEQRSPEYNPEFLHLDPPEVDMSFNPEVNFAGDTDDEGGMYNQILQWLPTQETISASYLVRKFKIGHPRAARMLDKLEEDGYISGPNGSKPREVYREHLLSANENEEF